MGNTTAQTNLSSLFDESDFAPAVEKKVDFDAIQRNKKSISLSSDYVIQRRSWTEEDTIALRERLAQERAGRNG